MKLFYAVFSYNQMQNARYRMPDAMSNLNFRLLSSNLCSVDPFCFLLPIASCQLPIEPIDPALPIQFSNSSPDS